MTATAHGGERLMEGAVRVPGSTSNLGAGFDCLGLAVDRWLVAHFLPDREGPGGEGGRGAVRLRREGTLAGLADPPDEDLLVRAFVDALGRSPAGLLTVTSGIPVGKGLGSSAAAVVAGAALADVVRGRPVDAEEAFRRARATEGHGDNAGPSAFGGLQAVVDVGEEVRSVRPELSPDVGFGFAAPSAPLSTRRARAALPAAVSHGAAAGAVRRVVALLRGLATADPSLLAAGLADELHVPYRLELIPGAARALEAAVAAGAWGATLSGAGSGLLVVGPRGRMAAASEAAAEALEGPAEAGVLEVVEEGVERLGD